MEMWGDNSLDNKFERGSDLTKSMDGVNRPIEENSRQNEDTKKQEMFENIQTWEDRDNSSCSNVDSVFELNYSESVIFDDTFLVSDSTGNNYCIYFNIFNIENYIFETNNAHSFFSEPFYLYSNSSNPTQMNEVSNEYNSQIDIAESIYNSMKLQIDPTTITNNENESVTDSSSNESIVYGESCNRSEVESSSRQINVEEIGIKYPEFNHLWILCDNCYQIYYKKFIKSKHYICEECGDYLQLSSSDRIDFLIDEKTWVPIDDEILSGDPIQFDIPFDEDSSKQMISECLLQCGIILDKIKEDSSKEMISECLIQCGILLKEDSSKERISEDPIPFDIPLKEVKEDSSEEILSENPIPFNIPWKENSYEENLDFYQIKTGLTEAVQTGLGQINGITVAIGVMDFKFMGGSMGSVVGEKITRLIEYATKNFLPLIIVSASGGARMQEGSLSLMQMAKISSALYNYQSNKRLFYISILTSPTTGGITASFGMLGDIIIVEPNAYIAFAGKRVIEETLKQTIPDEAQEAEFLFEKGSFDLIVPRHLLKSVISELFTFHDRGTFFHSKFKFI